MKFLLVWFILLSMPIFANTEVEIRRIIKNNPKNMQAYTRLIGLGTTREQITKFGNEALTAIGQRSQIYTAMGNAYMNAKDFNNAVNSYRMAVSMNPRSATAFNRLGLSLLRIGYFRQAEVAFRSAMAYSSANGPVNLTYKTYLGVALENQKDFTKAQKVIDEVLAVSPSLGIALEVKRRLAKVSSM